MKKELVDLQPKLEQAKIDNTSIMKVKTTQSGYFPLCFRDVLIGTSRHVNMLLCYR